MNFEALHCEPQLLLMPDHPFKLPRKKLIEVSRHVYLQASELLLRKRYLAVTKSSSNAQY